MNRKVTFLSVLGLALIGTTLCVARTSKAGNVVTGPATCNVQSSQWGTCSGTFLGVRNSPDPTDYVQFTSASATASGGSTFSISVSGKVYSCYVAPETDMAAQVGRDEVLNARGYFSVSWANGYCSNITLINGSQFGNY
jgi:hypothetical protein